MSDGDYQTEGWQPPTLVQLVRYNDVYFSHYKDGIFYYIVDAFTGRDSEGWRQSERYEFPVPLAEVEGAKLLTHDKASIFMRWIRKALQDKTLRKL